MPASGYSFMVMTRLGTPLLFFGSECVRTEIASEPPKAQSGLTSKAEEEGFKVS